MTIFHVIKYKGMKMYDVLDCFPNEFLKEFWEAFYTKYPVRDTHEERSKFLEEYLLKYEGEHDDLSCP